MDSSNGTVCICLINKNRNFDFACGDHNDVDLGIANSIIDLLTTEFTVIDIKDIYEGLPVLINVTGLDTGYICNLTVELKNTTSDIPLIINITVKSKDDLLQTSIKERQPPKASCLINSTLSGMVIVTRL